MSNMKPIKEIIKELQAGIDVELNTRHIFKQYYFFVFNFFRRKGMSPEDCQDLTQNAFISVYKGIASFRHDAKFETWLFKIALNIYHSELERRQAQKRREPNVVPSTQPEADKDEQEFAVNDPIDPQPSPAEVLISQERLDLLHKALLQLPVKMRCCAQLYWFKELSYEEIASVMSISINTVKAHIHQARTILVKELNF